MNQLPMMHTALAAVHAFLHFEGSLVVNYPYDDDAEGVVAYSKSADDAVFKMVSLAYSKVFIRNIKIKLAETIMFCLASFIYFFYY